MSDMSQVIIPKSDQLNADDLIAGPMTITITQVTIRGGQEQPIAISFEGDNGKPYKACKSMCRVMVTAWGADSKKYTGRSMTLYRDPSVKWGGLEVGGIRISHMSDIKAPLTLALTMTRANKKPFTVQPLPRPAGTTSVTSDAPPRSEAGADVSYKAQLEAAATLDDLARVWATVPKEHKAGLAASKEARKAALQQPASEQDDFVRDMESAERNGNAL